MASSSSSADVATDRPARYGKQLVAHLSRRNGGERWDDKKRGRIDLGGGQVDLSCAPGTLQLKVDAEAEDLDRLEDVVGRHLVRFGARDELVVQWHRNDGTAGTEQRKTEDDRPE
jgi:uncharacterized protein